MFLRLSRPHHHDTINILTVCYFKSIMENKNHQQENFKSTYQSLVNSARILFVEKGYQAVSIDEISGKALVTKGAFYHHFKNKKQLLSACYKQQLIMIDAYITTKTDLTNGWSALESIFEDYLDYINNGYIRNEATGQIPMTPEGGRYYENYGVQRFNHTCFDDR